MGRFSLLAPWLPGRNVSRAQNTRGDWVAGHEDKDEAPVPQRRRNFYVGEPSVSHEPKPYHHHARDRMRAFHQMLFRSDVESAAGPVSRDVSWARDSQKSGTGTHDSVDEEALANMSRIAEQNEELKRGLRKKVPGTIYKYWAFEPVLVQLGIVDPDDAQTKLFCFGFVTILVVQVVAPVAVLVNTTYKIDASHSKVGLGDWHYELGSTKYSFSNFMSRLLGTLFLFLFNLNAIQITRADYETAQRIGTIIRGLSDKKGVVVNRFWLWIGAIVNCWVVTICCLAMWPCFMIALNPKDVIFDALSLCFLWQLDDAYGVFTFLEGRWDEDFFGSLYEHFKEEDLENERSSDDEAAISLLDKSVANWAIVYEIAFVVLYLFLLTVPLSFIFTEGTDSINLFHREVRSEVDEMRQVVHLLDARLARMESSEA